MSRYLGASVGQRDYYVTVCAECLRASCWHDAFPCEKSRTARTWAPSRGQATLLFADQYTEVHS